MCSFSWHSSQDKIIPQPPLENGKLLLIYSSWRPSIHIDSRIVFFVSIFCMYKSWNEQVISYITVIAHLEKLGTWEHGILWIWATHRMNHGGKEHTWALFGIHLDFTRFNHLPAICPTSASSCTSTLQHQIQNIDFLRTYKLINLILQGANFKLLTNDSTVSWHPLHCYSTYSDKRKSESPDALRVFNNLELQKTTF